MSETRESLAEYAHEAWCGWMQYLFGKSLTGPNGTVIIPEWAASRWIRQSRTDYSDLPEEEKESDRAEADKMLSIMANDEEAARRTIAKLEAVRVAAEAVVDGAITNGSYRVPEELWLALIGALDHPIEPGQEQEGEAAETDAAIDNHSQ